MPTPKHLVRHSTVRNRLHDDQIVNDSPEQVGPDLDKPLMTVRQVASHLGLKPSQVYEAERTMLAKFRRAFAPENN